MGKMILYQKKKIGEQLYYCTFIYAIFLSFIISSNFIPILSSKMLHRCLYLAVLVLFIKVFGLDEFDKKRFVIKVIVYALAVVSWRQVRNIDILLYVSFILGAQNVSFRQLIKLYFGIVSILLIGTILVSQADVIRDAIYVRGHFHRHSLGIIYPTDMAAYVFYLVLAYYYLAFGKLTWRSFTIITLIDFVMYWQTQARNSFILILLSLPIVWIAQRAKQGNLILRGIASFYWTLIPLFAYGTLLLSWLYDKDNHGLRLLNKGLSNRLSLSHLALNKYGISTFGQHIIEHGFGGAGGLKQFYHPHAHYFYIDSSYMRLAILYGIIIGILLVVIMTIIAYRSTLYREFILAAIFMLISIHCIVEQHLFDISYNPFMIALVATSSINGKLVLENSGGKHDSK